MDKSAEKEASHKQGIEQGSTQKQIEVTKKMLEENLPIETISKYSSLSIKEIENLK